MDGSIDRDAAMDRAALERFEAFYDYAFPRVYRFAQRKRSIEGEAEALCRLIMVRALASLGGLRGRRDARNPDPSDLAIWLYSVARRVSEEVDADPALLRTIMERAPTSGPIGDEAAAGRMPLPISRKD